MCQNSCIPNKQALWMEKKKKKLERKKKLSQRNKVQYNQQSAEFVEDEIFLISSFLELSNKCFKRFFENDWKTVVIQLEKNVLAAFNRSLQMISDCLHWFQNLVMSKELKKDFSSIKKRLEFTKNVLKVLSDLFDVLQQYIHRFSIIKSMVPFDHRLYFDSNRRLHLPLITCAQVVNNYCVDEGMYFTRVLTFDDGLSGKALQRLDNSCEWKLKLSYGKLPWKKKDTCVRLINHERVFDLVFDSINESADLNSTHKVLKIVDDFQIWNEWQWTYLDGWMFSSDCLHHNLNWLNKFNVKSLEYITSFSRMIFFLKNWILYSTEAVFSNKRCSPQCQLLWNVNGFDLVSSKTALLRILLREEKGWYFGVMWISKEPCQPWEPFCENPCCIGWDSSRNQESVSRMCKTFPKKSPISFVSRQTRDEVKSKKYTTMPSRNTSNRLSSNKKTILNTIVDAGINLPEEKQQSICTLQ